VKRPALKLFFDGGARPNPGGIEIAVVARGQAHFRDDLGSGTNNDAEWLALLEALAVAERLGATDLILVGDSAPVIAQANGTQPCRSPELQRHLTAFRARQPAFASIRLRHIGRHQNLAGIALERRRSGNER
jgi:ribonuclease HI